MTAFYTTSLFAKEYNRTLCLSHGDCQASHPLTASGKRCLIIKTGRRIDGTQACAKRCYEVEVAYQCSNTRANQVGLCLKESFQGPSFDPSNPDCSNAIDPIY